MTMDETAVVPSTSADVSLLGLPMPPAPEPFAGRVLEVIVIDISWVITDGNFIVDPVLVGLIVCGNILDPIRHVTPVT